MRSGIASQLYIPDVERLGANYECDDVATSALTRFGMNVPPHEWLTAFEMFPRNAPLTSKRKPSTNATPRGRTPIHETTALFIQRDFLCRIISHCRVVVVRR